LWRRLQRADYGIRYSIPPSAHLLEAARGTEAARFDETAIFPAAHWPAYLRRSLAGETQAHAERDDSSRPSQ